MIAATMIAGGLRLTMGECERIYAVPGVARALHRAERAYRCFAPEYDALARRAQAEIRAAAVELGIVAPGPQFGW